MRRIGSLRTLQFMFQNNSPSLTPFASLTVKWLNSHIFYKCNECKETCMQVGKHGYE